MFSFNRYRRCLDFLKDYWKGDEVPNQSFLQQALRDKEISWWEEYNMPRPSKQEAKYASYVFVKKMRSLLDFEDERGGAELPSEPQKTPQTQECGGK